LHQVIMTSQIFKHLYHTYMGFRFSNFLLVFQYALLHLGHTLGISSSLGTHL
jgi:hypothetical protein